MDPALASKPGGVAAVVAAVIAVAVGGQDEGSSEQPRVEALELRPWLVACRHVVRRRVEHMCAVAASVRVVRRALRFRVPSVRSLQSQLTSSGAGLASERGRWTRVPLLRSQ